MRKLLTFILACASWASAQTVTTHSLSGVNYQTGTIYTFQAIDNTRLTVFTNASPVAVTLPSGITPLFGSGSIFEAQNNGAGLVTITCNSCTINGNASVNLATNQSATFYGDGTNYGAQLSVGGATPGGSNFQIQVNNGGVFGGITNPAPGNELVSAGPSAFPVFRPFTYKDIQDYAGIDCTGLTDSGAAFNTAATTFSNTYVKFGETCQLRTTIELVIQGQSNFVIHGDGTRSGTNGVSGPAIFGCNPAASTPVLYINRSGYFTLEGFGIWARGATPCNTSTFTGSLQFDSTGAPGVTSHDMILNQMGFTTSPQGGSISGYTAVAVTDGGQQNGEMVKVRDSWINCQNSPSSLGINIANGTSDNDTSQDNHIQNCNFGIRSQGNIRIVGNLFSSDGDSSVFGNFGANILLAACSSGNVWITNNEEDSGGPFIDNDHTGVGGCQSGVNVFGNHIGVTDVTSGEYIIDVGNSGTSEAWNLLGNTFLVTANTAQYIMGSVAQAANHGALAQLMDMGGNFLRPPTLSNTLGLSNPNLSMQGGETHVGLVGAFLPSPVSPQSNVNATTPSQVWYPTNPTGNTFKSQSPFLGLRSYYATPSLADDWLWQGIADANQSALIFNHNAGAAPTTWFGWDGQISGIKVAALATPGPPTGVSNVGTPGGTTYTYAIVAFGVVGNTAGSTTLSTATGNATLNSTNYNLIQWVPTASIGANKWCVWRTVSGGTPSTTGKIGCVNAVATTANAQNGLTYYLNDQGLAGDSSGLPVSNSTGALTVPAGINGFASIQCNTCNANSGYYWAATNSPAIQGPNGILVWDGSVNPAILRTTSAGALGSAAAPWGGLFLGNCAASGTAANPSVASCSGNAAGSVACSTSASTGTCQVNTTAVTANSEITVTQRLDTTTGTRLSVTCNTTVDTVQRAITAVTAGTSFTFNLGTFTTNPECFSYTITN